MYSEGVELVTAKRDAKYARTRQASVYDFIMTELQLLTKHLGVTDRTVQRSVKSGLIRGRRLSPKLFRLQEHEEGYLTTSAGLSR